LFAWIVERSEFEGEGICVYSAINSVKSLVLEEGKEEESFIIKERVN